MKRSIVRPIRSLCVAGLLGIAVLGLTAPTASTAQQPTAGCVYNPVTGGRCSPDEPA
jgi:hypothetical protein